jgi:predicted secreted hydrolase
VLEGREDDKIVCEELLSMSWNYKVILLVLALMLAGGPGCAGEFPRGDWKQAEGQRVWSFPKDHGAHPDYRTEWWYFTGNLADADGKKYGYQLTFFRQGLRAEVNDKRNFWLVRDIYLAHFALADVGSNSFWFSEQTSRSGPGLAGAKQDAMDVWCLNWSARMENGRIFLEAGREDVKLKLELITNKPLVLHGEKGFSQKGLLPGQASWYYSLTDLRTKGTLTARGSKKPVAVSGTSWFDQEFGSNQLSTEQQGWDWFALHLSDGRDLMLYVLRKKDGTVEPTSSGTLIEKNGRSRPLKRADIRIEALDHWKSPLSGGIYPARWQISISSADIQLVLAPLIADQELNTVGSTGVVYYEGAVSGNGKSIGKSVSCEGYVEMTGYAGALGGLI